MTPLNLFLLAHFGALVAAARHFTCVHDDILAQSAPSSVGGQQYGGGSGRRRLQEAWQPLRVVPVYVRVEATLAAAVGEARGAALASYLRNTLVPATIARHAALLSTRPVQGPLFATRACAASNSHGCAAFSSDLLTSGCRNNPPSADPTLDDEVIPFGPELAGAETTYSAAGQATTFPPGAGVPGADFVLFVTAKQTASCGSVDGGGVLAYATTCQRDQTGRPTWGRVNLCPGALDASPDARPQQLGIALHEVTHALGFTSESWPLFRNPDGSPKTPRDGEGQPPSHAYRCGGRDMAVPLPAENTVAYFAERGMAKCGADDAEHPLMPSTNCVRRAVGPAVVAAGRAFFACPSLPGVELENQQTTDCEVVGSHWEQRVLSSELMASYAQHTMRVSPMTLAMLEDSGWYRANYLAADAFQPGDWGYQQGCDFAMQQCVRPVGGALGGAGSPPHFLPASNDSLCTTDGAAKAFAAVMTLPRPIPPQYVYFPSATQGGDDSTSTLDFCPAVVAYQDGLCTDGRNGGPRSSPSSQWAHYGASSSCFMHMAAEGGSDTSRPAGAVAECFRYACEGDGSLTVLLGDGTAHDARCGPGSAGTAAPIPGLAGSVVCPDPARLCGATARAWVPSPTAGDLRAFLRGGSAPA